MFTRPADLGDDDVAAAVRDGWGIDPAGIEHVPRGFGSHHWRIADRWFVTVDEHAPPTHEPALRATRWLRDEHGLAFVGAPVPSAAGAVVEVLGDRWSIAVHPWVDGTAHDWGPYPDDDSRAAVASCLDRLHAIEPPPWAPVDDFGLPPMPSGEWDDVGPYSAPAARALADAATTLAGARARYAELVVDARTRPMVLTHAVAGPGGPPLRLVQRHALRRAELAAGRATGSHAWRKWCVQLPVGGGGPQATSSSLPSGSRSSTQ